MPQLTINKLSISHNNKKIVDLVNDDNESIVIKDSIALVGQSGSGKSLTLKTILNMTPNELEVLFKYDSNFQLDFNSIGFIPQNPFTSLSPMTKICKQFFCDNDKIDSLLKLVELDLEFKNKFPSQLSGGQLQRVVIAIALSKEPKILLLDEPTTALDTKNKNIILNLINELKRKMNFIIIFVSHDVDSIQDICKDIIILKDGRICEYGDTISILSNPKSDYTKKLIECNFKNREFRI